MRTMLRHVPSGDFVIYDTAVDDWDWQGSADYIEVPEGEDAPELLAAARLAKWERVKRRRERAQDGGVDVPGIGRVDSDPESRQLISGAVQMALIAQGSGEPLTIEWTLADNDVASLDAAAVIAMGLAVGAHVDACHGVARDLRSTIEGCPSAAALDAIDVDGAAWPD